MNLVALTDVESYVKYDRLPPKKPFLDSRLASRIYCMSMTFEMDVLDFALCLASFLPSSQLVPCWDEDGLLFLFVRLDGGG